MFRLINIVSTLFLILVCSYGSYSQENLLIHYTTADGLPESSINCTFKDSRGYLWVGTHTSGVSRFNGENFETFSIDDGLASNDIRCINEDEEGNIWLGTGDNSIIKYNGYNFKNYVAQSNYTNRVWDIQKNGNGELLFVGWQGKIHILKNGELVQSKLSQYFKNINQYVETDEYYFLTEAGIDKIYRIPKSNQIQIDTVTLLDGYVHNIFEVHGAMWTGSTTGVYELKFSDNALSTSKSEALNLPVNSHIQLLPASKDEVWFNTVDGIFYSTDKGKTITKFISSQLPSIGIVSVYKDSEGIRWFSTNNQGLYKMPPSQFRNLFSNDGEAKTITQSEDSVLWTVIYDKLYSIKEGEITLHPFTSGAINAILPLKQELYIGTNRDYIFKKDLISGNIMRLPFEYTKGVHRISSLKYYKSKIYAGTYAGGIMIYNQEGNRVEIIDPYQEISSWVLNSYYDSQYNFWICFDRFLAVTNKGRKQILDFGKKFRREKFRNIIQDFNGNYWTATPLGLIKFSINQDDLYAEKYYLKHEVFTTNSGLPSSNIMSLAKTSDNKMILGTLNGLSVIDLNVYYKSGEFIANNYGSNEGMHNTECIVNSLYVGYNDIIYIGTTNGISILDLNMKIQHPPPNLHITSFKLFNKLLDSTDYDFSPYTTLPTNLNLQYYQNNVSIDYQAIYHHSPNSVYYKYRLLGFEENWSSPTKNKTAVYSNLPAGEYTFQVIAQTPDTVTAPKEYKFVISSPFWQRYWFIGACVLLAVFLIYIILRIRTYNLQQQKKVLERRIEERTRQLKEQKERAENSEKIKEQFLANISHEMRTPLNAIAGLSHLLSKENLPVKQAEKVNTINTASINLTAIINDLLDFAKINSGKIKITKDIFNIEKVVKNNIDLMRVRAQEKRIALLLDMNITHPFLIGDSVRFSQILLNLLGNAVKFTEKGDVAVRCEQIITESNRCDIVLKVKDTGIGIDEKNIDRIFGDFEQESNTKTNQMGTGLGLAITKKLVELHDGEIKVKSVKNVGSEFTVKIPYEISNERKDVTRTDVNEFSDNQKFNLLLVEDNLLNQTIALDILKDLFSKIQIKVVDNGAEAIELGAIEQFDVILLDLQMPVMDGYETLKKIRESKNSLNQETPVIILSAEAESIESDMESYSIQGRISKPFNPEELKNIILQVINE